MRHNVAKYLQILVLALSFIVFTPAITGDFLNWDDTTYISENEILNKDVGLKSFLELYDYDAYISLTLASFQFQKQVLGDDSVYFHLINLLIHLINVFLVFYLAKILFRDRNTAFWIALIFAIHPFKVESVAWIIQRKDLLFSMFFLSGIIVYIKFIKTEKILWYLITAILAYLSILSKVTAISFVCILFILEYFIDNRISVKTLLLLFIVAFVQLSNINSVLLVFIYTIIPLFIIRFFNKITINSIESRTSSSSNSKIKKNIYKLLSNRRAFKIIFYGYLIVFIFNTIFSTIRIFFNPEYEFYIGFVFQTITYFLPVLIFIIFDAQNQDRLDKLISTIIKSRKVFFIGIVSFIAITIFVYYLAKPHFEEGEFLLSSIISIETIIYFSFSLVYYLFGFVFPFYQNAMHPYPEDGQYGLLLNLSPFILLVLSVVVFYLLKKITDKSLRKNIVFGLLFFLINIVIVLHIIPIRGRVIVAERYSYLAYLGLIFILVVIFKNYIAKSKLVQKRIFYFLFITLISAYSVQSFTRSNVYSSSYSFWSDVIEKNPKNHYAIFALGLHYYENSDYNTAIDKYSTAIALESEDSEYYLNRGSSYFKIDSINLALSDYNQAIRLNPNDYLNFKNRGILYYETGNLEQAVADFKICLQIDPTEMEVSELHITASQLLSEYNKYKISGTSSTSLSQYYLRLATNYAQKADYQQSLFLFNEALKYDSLNIDALKNSGNVYAMLEDFDNAKKHYELALKINPEDAGLYINLGNILHQLGDVGGACENWDMAVGLGKTEANKMIDQFCK